MLADEHVRGGGDSRGEGGDVRTAFLSAVISGILGEDGVPAATEPLVWVRTTQLPNPESSTVMIIGIPNFHDGQAISAVRASVATLRCHSRQ